MIPNSFYGRLAQPSPQQTERDLARLIHRTVDLAMRAKRELGYAAVNVGCDNVRRVTMFDGSACQVDGDVCLATREEGITVCLDSPRGAGLNFQSVSFAAPACASVTGWWIVDAEGYLYRVPASLITAAAYWPMTADPVIPEAAVTLVRAGTWARLMCGASVSLPLRGDGGAIWEEGGGECGWTQRLVTALGGIVSAELTTAPTIYADPGGEDTVYVRDGVGTVDGTPGYPIDWTVVLEAALTDGQSQRAVVTWGDDADPANCTVTYSAVDALSYPAPPVAGIVLARVIWSVAGSTVSAEVEVVGAAGDARAFTSIWPLEDPLVSIEASRAILLRDRLAPNAGSRVATVTLPSAGSGIVSGAVRVAYGHPFGTMDGCKGEADSPAPYTRPDVEGLVALDCAGRTAGDMALVYRRGLAVEYGAAHVCLDGDPIASVDDLAELDPAGGPPLDAAVGVVAMPCGEVAIFGDGPVRDVRQGKRYRVRPAPAAPLTVEVEHRAKGSWGDDPNPWIVETSYPVAAWGSGATVEADGDALSSSSAPGRAVVCVLWESDDPADDRTTAPVTYDCQLGETISGVTELLLADGSGPIALAPSTRTYRYLTIVGASRPCVAYGWTAVVLEDPDDPASPQHETALSPLAIVGGEYPIDGIGGEGSPDPLPCYSLKLTLPSGPDGTVAYNVYRWTWDFGRDTSGYWESPPWTYEDVHGEIGGLYDRHLRLVATSATDGVVYDEETTTHNVGDRPPSPLVYLGPIAIDAPRPVHVLQPMEL